jgi:hypothetical protein
MFNNTRQSVRRILESLDGIPEECSWIDYKAACNFNAQFKEKIKYLAISFMNSLTEVGKPKYIIFGVEEDKQIKKKKLIGLGEYKFPDDNEWQNLFNHIKPFHPNIETGTLEYRGLLLGYILINADNYYVPYYCKKKEHDVYYIRRGGNKYDDMTSSEKNELIRKKDNIIQNGIIYPKSEIVNTLVALGQYNESNKNDIDFIETQIGWKYEDIKSYCLNMDNLLSQNEKSIYGVKSSETSLIQNNYSRLLQFDSDEVIYALDIVGNVLGNEKVMYSEELLDGITDTMIFLSNNGFSFYAQEVIKSTININSFKNQRNTTIFSRIAEVSPCYILNMILENNEDILVQKARVKTNIIEALRVIAWFPEYYEEAVKLLIKYGDNEIYELFMCGGTATAASFEQKLLMVEEIGGIDQNKVFNILNKAIYFNPNIARFLSHAYIPERYKRLYKGVHRFKVEQLQTYYDILIKITENNVEKILKLLPDWLPPFPFSNLQLLAAHIENVEPSIESIDDRQKLWNRLCNTPLIYITDSPVEEALKNRLVSVGNKFKPDDLYKQYQKWFRNDVITNLCLDGTNYDDAYNKVKEEQKGILLNLYRQKGIDEMIAFINTVHIDSYKLMKVILSDEFSLTIEDDVVLLSAFLGSPKMYSSYFRNKSYCKGLVWIKEIKVERLDARDKASFFAVLNPTRENIQYFEEMLGDEIELYWTFFDYKDLSDVLVVQYVFEKLMYYSMPEKAFCLLEYLQTYMLEQLPSQWIFDTLISIEDFKEYSIPIYSFATIYHYLCTKLNDNMLERLEVLSFKLYGKIPYNYGCDDLKPSIIFKKIVNEPEFFIGIVKKIMNDPLGLEKHLMNHCNVVPDTPCDWVKVIDDFIVNETKVFKEKIEYWTGYILYNNIKSVNDNFEIEDLIAGLLEKSEKKRQGFLAHAYFPNGYHSNGSYKEDSKDRINAGKYRKMSTMQEEKGNIEFGKALNNLADALINNVELEI